MELIKEISPLVSYFSLVFSIIGIFISNRNMNRTESSELFSLRQRVIMGAESARTSWYAILNEITLIKIKLNKDEKISISKKKLISDFLEDFNGYIDNCILDANAMADDIHLNSEKFNKEKCEYYLKLMEPSIEKINRNRGIIKERVEEMMAN